MTTLFLPEIRDVSNAVRPLGAVEHFFLLLDKRSPVHFSVTAEVSGRTTVDDWRRAIDHVQARHGLLSINIASAPGAVPWIRKAEGLSIPLRVVHGDPAKRWMAQVSSELAMPFNPAQAPLVRAVLVHSADSAAITFLAHHSIADGMSLAYLLRDVLSALAGNVLERLPAHPSMEEILRNKQIGKDASASANANTDAPQVTPGIFREHDGSGPQIRKLQLSQALTADLARRAKDEQTTVHAALCAALSIAGRKSSLAWGDAVKIMSPVNIRNLLGVGDDCGVFVGAAASVTDSSQKDFWDVARKTKADISPSQTPAGVKAFADGVQQFMDSEPSVDDIGDFSAVAFAAEAMLSNLGVLPFDNTFGPFEIQAVWGPCVLRGFEGDHTLGVTTINGTLCMVHTSFAPAADDLLETMAEILKEACSRSRREI